MPTPQQLAATALLALVVSLSFSAGCTPHDARTVYLGGPVIALDGAGTIAEALGVEGDRIAAVGSEAHVREWGGDDADIVDLAGHALLPGFIDAHGHFPGAGIYAINADLNSPPIGSVEDLDTLVARLSAHAADRDPGEWVVGMGYDDSLLAEARHPTRDDLDRVSTDHPVIAWHISLHVAACNTPALERLGIDASTADPEGGVVRRRAGTREPDGVLEEEATTLVASQIAAPSLREGLAIMREGSALYLAAGVTTAQSGMTAGPLMTALPWASRLGLIPLRLVLWPSAEAADSILAEERGFSSYDERWVRTGAVKLFADGSIQAYTGYLSEPYHVPPGDDPDFRGYPRMSRDRLIEQVARYHDAGLQVAIHGNGDAAIDDILVALERAQREHPRSDARHVIIHAQMARDDQLDRMRALGVIPSFFSLHTYYWGDRHRDRFMGPERAARMSPARSAADRGLRFTLHADSPVVPMEPLRLVWAAVNRRSSSGAPIGPKQRISALRALRAVTLDAAYQHFEEDQKGSLEVGKLADLVILSASPLDHPDRIDELRVVETVVGGERLYPR